LLTFWNKRFISFCNLIQSKDDSISGNPESTSSDTMHETALLSLNKHWVWSGVAVKDAPAPLEADLKLVREEDR